MDEKTAFAGSNRPVPAARLRRVPAFAIAILFLLALHFSWHSSLFHPIPLSSRESPEERSSDVFDWKSVRGPMPRATQSYGGLMLVGETYGRAGVPSVLRWFQVRSIERSHELECDL